MRFEGWYTDNTKKNPKYFSGGNPMLRLPSEYVLIRDKETSVLLRYSPSEAARDGIPDGHEEVLVDECNKSVYESNGQLQERFKSLVRFGSFKHKQLLGIVS